MVKECPNCQHIVDKEDKYCPECGAILDYDEIKIRIVDGNKDAHTLNETINATANNELSLKNIIDSREKLGNLFKNFNKKTSKNLNKLAKLPFYDLSTKINNINDDNLKFCEDLTRITDNQYNLFQVHLFSCVNICNEYPISTLMQLNFIDNSIEVVIKIINDLNRDFEFIEEFQDNIYNYSNLFTIYNKNYVNFNKVLMNYREDLENTIEDYKKLLEELEKIE